MPADPAKDRLTVAQATRQIERQRIIDAAPHMPGGFYGSIVYDYQDGRLVMAEVSEKIKPNGR